MKQMFKTLLGKLLVALLLLLPLASQAFDSTHVYAIVNYATGQCLEIGGNDLYQVGHQANLYGYWGGANQQWQFEYISYQQYGLPGHYLIVNRNSRQVLEIAALRNCGSNPSCTGYPASQNFRTTAGNSPGDPAQLWDYLFDSATGAYRLSVWGGGGNQFLAAGPNNYSVVNVYGNSGDNQLWNIIDVSANPAGNLDQSVFQIINAHSGKALTGSRDDNHVSQYTNWGLANQEWSFAQTTGASHPEYFINNRNTSQLLEIGGGATTPGSTLNMWGNYDHPWQKWVFYRYDETNPNNYLTLAQAVQLSQQGIPCIITSTYAGKVVEIGGAGSQLYAEDRAANLWYNYGSTNDNQRWYVQFSSTNRTAGPTTTTTATPPQKERLGTTAPAGKLSKQPVSLYPNPAHSILTVEGKGLDESASVKVTDVRGAATTARYLGNGRIDVESLTPGFYMVTVSCGGNIHHQKFTKE